MEIYKNSQLNNLEGEVWKDIPNYEGLYKASNLGRIKSLERKKTGLNQIISEHIQYQYKNSAGYLLTQIFKDGQEYTRLIHRLVALTFISNPNNLPQVNHRNMIKFDNKIENLEWTTHKRNIQHAWDNKHTKNGRWRGENNFLSKLTDKTVLEIRNKYIPYVYGYKKLAKEYNLPFPTIYKVIKRITWKHI